MRELNEKAQRSQQAVESFKDAQAHKNMLNKERSKLKEGDMKNVHMRARRLELRRKKSIVEKEIMNSESVKKLKNETVKLRENSYIASVKKNLLKQDYARTMDAWASNGFTKYPKNGSPDLLKEFGGSFKKKKGTQAVGVQQSPSKQ